MVTQWEYTRFSTGNDKEADAQLEELGKEGWELVSAFAKIRTEYMNRISYTGMDVSTGPTTYIFKRPLRQTHPVGPYAGSGTRDVSDEPPPPIVPG